MQNAIGDMANQINLMSGITVKQPIIGGKTMPFTKGDPNINRNGRPKNAEPELLREALRREGVKRGKDFWERVAEVAYTDKNVMIAVVKKFVPDSSTTKLEGAVHYTQMPSITINGKPLEFDIGETP